jgi:hypothetical protein
MIRLASSPEPHALKPERTALGMFKTQNMTEGAHRNIAEQGPQPMPGPNPEPDAAISPADWDVLFNAVTERLEACSGLAPLDEIPELEAEPSMGRTRSLQATVRDCVNSMNRLHAALPRDWHPRKSTE